MKYFCESFIFSVICYRPILLIIYFCSYYEAKKYRLLNSVYIYKRQVFELIISCCYTVGAMIKNGYYL